MILDGGSARAAHPRYLLDTLLGALGVPYRIAGAEGERPPVDRCVCLAAGPGDTAAFTPTLSQRERGNPPLPLGEGWGEGLRLLDAFSILARREEYETAERDAHGRFLWAHSSHGDGDAGARPVVSQMAHRLLASIKEACAAASLPLIRKEFWPHARPMAACLTHDIDVVRRGKLPRGIALRDVAGALRSAARGHLLRAASQATAMARIALSGQDPYWTFDRILALEREHGFRSTYFVMAGRRHPEDAAYNPAHPRMMKLLFGLAEAGCEIGLHGSCASYRDPASLSLLKTLLETQLGWVVAGHRNHLLRFQAPDSWRTQEAAGFSYDATLGFADREGYRGGHSFPFRPYDLAAERVLDLLEIPLAAMDVTLFKYRHLRGVQAENALLAVLEQTRGVHGLATLLWHNDTFYDPDYPGSGLLYQRALAWLAENGAWVAPCAEVDRWWRAREAAVLAPLPPGRTGWRVETPQEIEGLVLRLWSPTPGSSPRVGGPFPTVIRRDGPDHLVEFGRLPAGAVAEIELY